MVESMHGASTKSKEKDEVDEKKTANNYGNKKKQH